MNHNSVRNNFHWLILIILLVSGCGKFPAPHLPSAEISNDEIANYIIAYCWQYSEGRQSKTFPDNQEVVIVVSSADGAKSTIIRNKLNLPDQHLSDSFIYKSGCIKEGDAIRYIGNAISWWPNTDEITFTEGPASLLTIFSSSIVTNDFVLRDGNLSALIETSRIYFAEPRGVYWSSDGSKLATLARDINDFNSVGDNIWVFNSETGEYSRVTRFRAAGNYIANASWSKDGSALAVEYIKSSGIGIAKFESNSTVFSYVEVTHTSHSELSEFWPYAFTSWFQLLYNQRNMDFNDYVAQTSLPVWVNDDKQIVFGASSESGKGTLFIVDSDGGNLRPLLPDRPGLIFMPTLSPNGKTVAFVRYPSWKDKSRVEIATVDMSTMEIKSLAVLSAPKNRETLLISGMNWSPDGKYLAFSSNHEGESDIYILSSDGKAWINLTKDMTGNAVSPAWKP